jgi:hypothetical protein
MRRTTCASLLIGLLAALTLPSPAGAAPAAPALPVVAQVAQADAEPSSGVHDWDNLGRLRPGDRIVVTTTRTRSLEGRFGGYTAEAITFTVDGESVSIDRENVAEVLWREKSHRVRNAVLTLGVSLLVGMIAGAGAEASDDRDQASEAASSLSLQAGSATHEALPTHPVIYRAPGPSTD